MYVQCDSRCGRGNQTRLVWCVTVASGRNHALVDNDIEDIEVVPDEHCERRSKPPVSRDCDVIQCDVMPSGHWVVSSWSGVSVLAI